MNARERSLNNAIFVSKSFGLGLCGVGLAMFGKGHWFGTGLVSLGILVVGAFFLSVARVEPGGKELRYRRWFRWEAIPYSEIMECGEFWRFGYIRLRNRQFPRGRMYFARANASDSLFGLDKSLISTIRSKAQL
jgi:hypothetical protein